MSGIFKAVTSLLGIDGGSNTPPPPPTVVEVPKPPTESKAEDIDVEEVKKKEDLETGRNARRKRNVRSGLLASFKDEEETKARTILKGD